MIPVAHIELAVNGNPHVVGDIVFTYVHNILHLVRDVSRQDWFTGDSGREKGEEVNERGWGRGGGGGRGGSGRGGGGVEEDEGEKGNKVGGDERGGDEGGGSQSECTHLVNREGS